MCVLQLLRLYPFVDSFGDEPVLVCFRRQCVGVAHVQGAQVLPRHRRYVCLVVYVTCLLCVFVCQPVCCLPVLFPSLCVNVETLMFLGVVVLCCVSCPCGEPCHCLTVTCVARIM